MKYKLTLLGLLSVQLLFAQDTVFARKIVDTLSSSGFWGRGYTKNGVNKAANFLSAKFAEFGLQPLPGKTDFQKYKFPVNTFPGKMEVAINGVALVPGVDFIVAPESISAKATGKLVREDSVTFMDRKNHLIISLENKLTWSVAQQAADYTHIKLDKNRLTAVPESFSVNIENKFVPDFSSLNVVGMIKGTAVPDSILVMSAHFDHLGGMGSETYFPGANDNASGTSFLLGLARYYAKHPQRYSMVFICFSGEEAGLLGSKYFISDPLIDLKKIRFLLNVDMVGTGNEGITVVNATLHQKEFAWMKEINESKKYLPKIASRGKAANSDHYFFSEKGVPAFFIYTMGGIRAYHDVFDVGKTLPLTAYEDLFKLVVAFNEKLQN